jgi:hypothetical protein
MQIEATLKFRHGYLRTFLKQHKLTYVEFSKKVNICACTVVAVINLKKQPTYKTKEKIFNYIKSVDPEVTLDILFPPDFEKAVECFADDRVVIKEIDFNHFLEYEKERLQLPSPHQETYLNELKTAINMSLGKIENIKSKHEIKSVRNREITELYYGINGKFPHNLDEIAEILNVSSERVRHVKNKTLNEMLRDPLFKDVNDENFVNLPALPTISYKIKLVEKEIERTKELGIKVGSRVKIIERVMKKMVSTWGIEFLALP